jgi:Integrase core domain
MTDNGPAYVSLAHSLACRALGLRHLRTRPYRPRTNGKAERFIRTMLGSCAYGAIYASSQQRTAALDVWLDHYKLPTTSRRAQPPAAGSSPRAADRETSTGLTPRDVTGNRPDRTNPQRLEPRLARSATVCPLRNSVVGRAGLTSELGENHALDREACWPRHRRTIERVRPLSRLGCVWVGLRPRAQCCGRRAWRGTGRGRPPRAVTRCSVRGRSAGLRRR